MIPCPHCKRQINAASQICTYCGGLLNVSHPFETTRSLGDTDFEEVDQKWGTARFGERMNLVLRVAQTDNRFVFDAEQISKLVIGRLDATLDQRPEVDLQPFDATDKGVSRRHASIIRRDGALHLVDLEAPNGTYLNGQRLIPNQPRVLRDGDQIRLGHLVLNVEFVRIATKGT